MKSTLLAITVLMAMNSNASVIKEAWNNSNNPDRMQVTRNSRNFRIGQYNYTKTFSDLPLEGQLTTRPWSGDYWPTHKGGITYRWNEGSWGSDAYGYPLLEDKEVSNIESTANLSPAEKFDLYLGRYEFPLTKYERERTNIMKTIEDSEEYDSSFEIPSWEGLCHAWAPATMAFVNPKAVTVTNKNGMEIEFGASDIKALLTYFLHYDKSSTSFFLGGRCNVDFSKLDEQLSNDEITQEQYDRKKESMKCRDTNAGAFHLVLTNQIALLDEGFVADVTRDLEVWNQPIHGYESEIISEISGKSEGAARGTVREVEIKTTMNYTTEIGHSFSQVIPSYNSNANKYYHYKIELNEKDEIIGGEWISDNRPDFLWKQTIPEFTGFFAPLKEVYEKSIL
ncbi:hypothetical protein A9Q84_09980 [Halobacteriovorax marinus]|uniref:Uncharacterized protein n=1 Tax=Halobacteriovorax marinus TaxID=97084 RepID=A0A1Y5FDJ0_9BACT|nr:hypothetical protein A9Q84_09980 [Halobacteriovorax marinus]